MKKYIVPGLAIIMSAALSVGPAGAQTPSVEQLSKKLEALESKYQRMADKDEIERLQRVYGYYIERGDLDEVADLFSTAPDVTLDMSGRVLKGHDNVRRMFSSAQPFGVMTPGAEPKDYLHITAPISGVVDVAEDGRTAKGRWYALMFLNNAGMGGGAVWGIGIYENDYVKEGGVWKISRLGFDDIILSTYDKKGWINSMPSFNNPMPPPAGMSAGAGGPPPGRGRSKETPFADIMPYHYKNPVTGK